MRSAKLKRREMGWLTIAEFAALTCFPKGAIRDMADRKELKTVRVGTRHYVAETEVERLKAAQGVA
jgi:excisionase family DNA binding protein